MRLAYYLLLSAIIALALFLLCLIGPLYLFRLYNGIGLNAAGPTADIFFMLAGGVIAPAAALWAQYLVLHRLGGYGPKHISTPWAGQDHTPNRHEPHHPSTWPGERTPQH